MTKVTKTLLGVSIAGIGSGLLFVTGLINAGDNAALYISLPAGAIFLGLFLISLLLEKETALFDSEHQLLAPARATQAEGGCDGSCGCSGKKMPRLVEAH